MVVLRSKNGDEIEERERERKKEGDVGYALI